MVNQLESKNKIRFPKVISDRHTTMSQLASDLSIPQSKESQQNLERRQSSHQRKHYKYI